MVTPIQDSYGKLKVLLNSFESNSSEWSNDLSYELANPIKQNLLNRISISTEENDFFRILEEIEVVGDRQIEFEPNSDVDHSNSLQNNLTNVINTIETAKVRARKRMDKLHASLKQLRTMQDAIVKKCVEKTKAETGFYRLQGKVAEYENKINKLTTSLLDKRYILSLNKSDTEMTVEDLRHKYETNTEDKIRNLVGIIERKTIEVNELMSSEDDITKKIETLHNEMSLLLHELDLEERNNSTDAVKQINPIQQFRAMLHRVSSSTRSTAPTLFGDDISGIITQEIVDDSFKVLKLAAQQQQDAMISLKCAEDRLAEQRTRLSQVLKSEDNKALERLKTMTVALEAKIESDEKRVAVLEIIVKKERENNRNRNNQSLRLNNNSRNSTSNSGSNNNYYYETSKRLSSRLQQSKDGSYKDYDNEDYDDDDEDIDNDNPSGNRTKRKSTKTNNATNKNIETTTTSKLFDTSTSTTAEPRSVTEKFQRQLHAKYYDNSTASLLQQQQQQQYTEAIHRNNSSSGKNKMSNSDDGSGSKSSKHRSSNSSKLGRSSNSSNSHQDTITSFEKLTEGHNEEDDDDESDCSDDNSKETEETKKKEKSNTDKNDNDKGNDEKTSFDKVTSSSQSEYPVVSLPRKRRITVKQTGQIQRIMDMFQKLQTKLYSSAGFAAAAIHGEKQILKPIAYLAPTTTTTSSSSSSSMGKSTTSTSKSSKTASGSSWLALQELQQQQQQSPQYPQYNHHLSHSGSRTSSRGGDGGSNSRGISINNEFGNISNRISYNNLLDRTANNNDPSENPPTVHRATPPPPTITSTLVGNRANSSGSSHPSSTASLTRPRNRQLLLASDAAAAADGNNNNNNDDMIATLTGTTTTTSVVNNNNPRSGSSSSGSNKFDHTAAYKSWNAEHLQQPLRGQKQHASLEGKDENITTSSYYRKMTTGKLIAASGIGIGGGKLTQQQQSQLQADSQVAGMAAGGRPAAALQEELDVEFYSQNYGLKIALEQVTTIMDLLSNGSNNNCMKMLDEAFKPAVGDKNQFTVDGNFTTQQLAEENNNASPQTVEELRLEIQKHIALIRDVHFRGENIKQISNQLQKQVASYTKEAEKLRSELLQQVEGAHWSEVQRPGQYEIQIAESKDALVELKQVAKQLESRVSKKRDYNIRLSQIISKEFGRHTTTTTAGAGITTSTNGITLEQTSLTDAVDSNNVNHNNMFSAAARKSSAILDAANREITHRDSVADIRVTRFENAESVHVTAVEAIAAVGATLDSLTITP